MVLGRDAVFRHERQPAVRLHPEQSLLRHDDRDHLNMTFTVGVKSYEATDTLLQ